MKKIGFFLIILMSFGFLIKKPFAIHPKVQQPERPESGYGSTCNEKYEVGHLDMADVEVGYWAFYPKHEKLRKAPVIIFMHGYGAINPVCYGSWIDHLVKEGNIVIYPRYQEGILTTSSDEFVSNATLGIKNALKDIPAHTGINPDTTNTIYVGHSYGGAINANIAANYQTLGLPSPKGVMLCQPGTAMLEGSLLESYQNIPDFTKLLCVVGENDKVVQDKLGRIVYETATNTPQRNLIIHVEDNYGNPVVTAEHREPYSIDRNYDKGIHNITVKRAFGNAEVSSVDFYCYWKLLDALSDCVKTGENCHVCLGNTPEQTDMGTWSDGMKVKPLQVFVPKNTTIVAK